MTARLPWFELCRSADPYPTDRTVRIVEVYDAYNGRPKPQPRLPDPGRRS